MKKVWKWIIGIVIVLVVLVVVVGGAFLLRSHFNFNGITRVVQVPNGRIPFNGNNNDGQRGGPGWMMPYGGRGYPMRGPGMMGFGRMFPFAGIIGGLFFLGFLALVVLGIIWLVRSQNRPQPVAVASTMTAAAAPEPPASPAVMTHPCKKCGQPVQEGWNHCPNCGKKQ
jgi:hypothetical protein